MQVRTEAMLQLFGDHLRAGDAALQATYGGRDVLREFLRGRISVWQLRGLVEALPPDSAFHRAVRENDWADGDWISRDTNSVLRAQLALIEAFLAGEKRPKKPDYLPSPLDGRDVRDAAEQELDERQLVEMQEVADGWFANN
ncbi:hypothetical protein NYS48_09740 [Curtobacterium flaccumfaciens pv. flaccumfaciens]|uniref:hypothetical protein n=1 Tax=Curtobacterium poinsettiae TaxID=159612 RepID=UPI00217E7D60|nr:hypothetical protein [Curtobacterium flaccumfaciens]MCS6565594.1 hypothetical protein [Curtobacterium flaccumfaciens pv. flaccumfaciens]